jgi:hypothetical protein
MVAVTRITSAKTSPAATRSNAVKTLSSQRYFVPTDMPAIAQLWLFRLLLKRGGLNTYLLQEQMINKPNSDSLGLSQQIMLVKKPGMVKFILQAKSRELAADPKVGIPSHAVILDKALFRLSSE